MVVRIYLVHFHHHVCEHVTAKRVCVCIYGLAHIHVWILHPIHKALSDIVDISVSMESC